ncbi:heparinase II/III domain-containing protein [Paenibacillus oceani]|uniref:Heparinase II/III family protein n=1 Tax=Paenibacillus oceani TaxID=2772510 RepID=A0A927CBB7_9BACL|nr:heparinase II/III family protein [Paenibacillus oceani]MBD2863121.1 heparinase II/III family protein [Paenibacillus oceani]
MQGKWKQGLTRVQAGVLIVALASPGWTAAGGSPVTEPYEGESAAVVVAPEVAVHTDRWLTAQPTSVPVQTDGVWSESVWEEVYGTGGFSTAFFNEQAEQQTIMKLAYDDTHLYIALDGQYESGYSAANAPEAERVFVLLSRDDDMMKFYSVPVTITPGPHPIRIRYNNFTAADVRETLQVTVDLTQAGQSQQAVSKRSDGWSAEVSIPLSALGVDEIEPGERWHVNAIRYFGIASQRPLSSWAPVRRATVIDGDGSGPNRGYTLSVYTANEGRFGSLYFGGRANAPVSGKPVVAWPLTTPARLLYDSFTEKQLILQESDWNAVESSVDMRWTSPHGEQTSIVPVSSVSEGNERVLSFTHPEPLQNGTYRLQVTAEENGGLQARQLELAFDRDGLIAAGDKRFPVQPLAAVTHLTPAAPSPEVALLLTLVPEKVGMFFAGVPHAPELSERATNYTWSVADPWALTSTDSGKLKYPNAQYPENKQLTVTNRLGQTVDYPYYEDANGTRYFLSAHLWYLQRQYLLTRTRELALTDPLGAARLIHRFAEVFPGWVPMNDYDKGVQYPVEPAGGPPYPYYGGLWSRWSQSELNALGQLADAYAIVKRTNAFDLLSAELGEDADARIVEDMFRPTLDYFHSFPVIKHNNEVLNYIGLIALAKALNDPALMHEAVELVERYAANVYMLDGFWKEVSVTYHKDSALLLSRAAEQAAGWSDPPGYVSPRTGTRLEQLDLLQRMPQLPAMLGLAAKLTYPDGRVLPINDTWAFYKPPQPQDTGSLVLPGGGIAKLARGQGAGQTMLYMGFSPNNGHDHKDPLNLTLYANGQELLPDIGYTHTKYRQWSASTLAHNTVVVDGRDASISGNAKPGGLIREMVKLGDAAEVVRAEQSNAYPQTETYGREPWLIGFHGGGANEAYVLDLFRVTGGARHEYTLNGDANRTAYFETEAALQEYGPYLLDGNPAVVEPVNEYDTGTISDGQYHGYMHVRNVRSAALEDGRFEATLRTMEGAGARSNLRISGFAGTGASQLFIGESPSLQATRLKGLNYDTQTEAVKHFMPKLVVRREGTALKSNFITVLEPFASGQQPRIEHIEVLHSDEQTGAAAVAITYGNMRDIVLSAPQYAGVPLVVGDLRLDGKLGFIRLVDGQIEQMRLADGTRLSKGAVVITAGGAVQGTIVRTERERDGDGHNALVTEAAVPQSAAGRYVIVTHPDGSAAGYRIESVQPGAGETALVLGEQEPGFTIGPDGRSGQLYFPMKQWTGAHTLHLANLEASGFAALPQLMAGTVSGTVYGPGLEPLDGANVNVSGFGGFSAVTGPDGAFVLPQVPGGWQRVTAKKDGYRTTVSDAVYVEAGQTVSVPLKLDDNSPPMLTGAPAVGAGIGESIQAASSRDGWLYLVPESVPPVPSQLETAVVSAAVYAARAEAAAHIPALLDTSGFAAGRYLLYAVDGRGRVSAGSLVWLLSTVQEIVDNEDSLVGYSGTWTTTRNDDRHIGSSAVTATSDGAYAEIPFYGARAQLLGVRFHTHGKAAIYVDGEYRTTVDNYRASWKAQEVLFDTGELPEGAHIIRYERLGEKNAASSNYLIHFDALRVMTAAQLPPVAARVGEGPVAVGSPVAATSSKSATLYLVPRSTSAIRSAIEAAAAGAGGSSVTVTASAYGLLDTTGFSPGLYSVYAIDANGVLSEPLPPIPVIDPGATIVDSAGPVVYYSGSWYTTNNDSRHIGNSAVTAMNNGAYADIPFYGKRAQLLGVRFHAHGKAAIYIDGEYRTTVDNYRAAWKAQEIIFDTGALPEGLHTIRYERIGEKNPAASDYLVHFDALRVTNEP